MNQVVGSHVAEARIDLIHVNPGVIQAMQIKGQPERIFKPGETFLETPSDVPIVSANASREAPARFLAYFVCDRKTALSVPATEAEKR